MTDKSTISQIFGALMQRPQLLSEVDKYSRDVFYVKVPERSGIGLAIYNRMLKACGHTVISL